MDPAVLAWWKWDLYLFHTVLKCTNYESFWHKNRSFLVNWLPTAVAFMSYKQCGKYFSIARMECFVSLLLSIQYQSTQVIQVGECINHGPLHQMKNFCSANGTVCSSSQDLRANDYIVTIEAHTTTFRHGLLQKSINTAVGIVQHANNMATDNSQT